MQIPKGVTPESDADESDAEESNSVAGSASNASASSSGQNNGNSNTSLRALLPRSEMNLASPSLLDLLSETPRTAPSVAPQAVCPQAPTTNDGFEDF